MNRTIWAVIAVVLFGAALLEATHDANPPTPGEVALQIAEYPSIERFTIRGWRVEAGKPETFTLGTISTFNFPLVRATRRGAVKRYSVRIAIGTIPALSNTRFYNLAGVDSLP